MARKARFESLRARPYRNIFMALVVVTAVDALAPNVIGGTAVSDVLLVAILAAALFETIRTRRHAVVAGLLGGPAVIARLAAPFQGDSPGWNGAVIFLTAAFMGFLIWLLLHDLFAKHRSTSERIYGALCAYLFIGILFALLYAHLEYRAPGSFNVGNDALLEMASEEASMVPLFTYYSFVTLTTLGYGDITPATDHARSLAWLEALIGQLYLAVMVATLVGIKVSEARGSAEDGGNRA
jgi:hypothetical protein